MIDDLVAGEYRFRELERECEEKGIPVDMYLDYVKKNYGTISKYDDHIKQISIDCENCYSD